MDFLKSIFVCTLLIFLSCGKNKDAIIKDSSIDVDFSQFVTDDDDKSSLRLSLPLSTGETLDLTNDEGKPTILIFSGEFCLTCREEHKTLIEYTNGQPELLDKVNLYTVFIRIKQNKAPLLKRLWGIP